MGIFEQLYPLLLPLFITGLISGFLAGLLGVGGGIVIVPILSYLLEVSGLHTQTPMHVAVASSLAIIVPTSIFSARAHFRLGNIDADVIRKLGVFVFIGASGGAIIADMLNNAALKFIFGGLAVMIGISFLIKVIMIRKGLPALGGACDNRCFDWCCFCFGGDWWRLFDSADFGVLRLGYAQSGWHFCFDGAGHRCARRHQLYDCRTRRGARFRVYDRLCLAACGGDYLSWRLSFYILGCAVWH